MTSIADEIINERIDLAEAFSMAFAVGKQTLHMFQRDYSADILIHPSYKKGVYFQLSNGLSWQKLLKNACEINNENTCIIFKTFWTFEIV